MRKGALHMEAQPAVGPALRYGLLLLILATVNQFSVAHESAAEARKDDLLRWFGGLEFPDVQGREFVRLTAVNAAPVDEDAKRQHYFGFAIEEAEETLTLLGVNLSRYECQKGALLQLWSMPVERAPAKLDEYAKSCLKYDNRLVRSEMSDYNIMEFGSLSPCTEAVALAWACERNGLHRLATRLFARAERDARKRESLYYAPHIPTWDSLDLTLAREEKKYTSKPTLRQIVERDVSRMRAELLLDDLQNTHPTRPQLLARLETFQRLLPNSKQAEPLPRTIVLLRQMIEEDERAAHLRRDRLPFSQLGREEQVAELIFQLRDQRGGTIDTPSCFVFYDDDNSPARQLALHGFDAIPQLIEALGDTRLTRAVGCGDEYVFTDKVLRVGDCAEQILARIAGIRSFAEHTSRGAELMSGDNAARVRTAAQTWFDEAKENGELRTLCAGVAKGGWFCEGQAEILVAKHAESALPSLLAGIQARGVSGAADTQWRLVRFVHQTPGDEATAYLTERARNAPSIVDRYVTSWGLHQRGRPEGVETMLGLWSGGGLDPPKDQNPGDSFNSFATSEVIWFLVNCGRVAAVDAVAKRVQRYDVNVIEQAILDVAFRRNTFYGGPDCVPDAAPEAVRDDPAVVREAQVKLLAELLNNKSAIAPSNFGRAGPLERWRGHSRICDFAAAALAWLDADRFQFDIGDSEPERDEQIARLKLLR